MTLGDQRKQKMLLSGAEAREDFQRTMFAEEDRGSGVA